MVKRRLSHARFLSRFVYATSLTGIIELKIHKQQVGHAILRIDGFDEDYLITLPALHIDGLISGSPYVELENKSYIISSTGYTSKIDYTGKGWVSGKKNTFAATLYPTGKEKEILYKADGQWSESFTIKDPSKNIVETHDPKKTKTTPLNVASIEEQDDLESRRAWQKVAGAIAKGDLDAVSREKSIIENQQRELRKKEREESREWERRFFRRADKFPIFDVLAKPTGESIEKDKTNGIWVFDGEKAKNSSPPFREQ